MPTEIHSISLGFDNCYVLKDEGVVVVDAGQPNRLRSFRRGLEGASIRPEEVSLILLTHAHWDHMGSAAAIKEYTGAPLAVHRSEAAWVVSGSPPLPPGITRWGRIFMGVHRLFNSFINVEATNVDIELTDKPWSLTEFGVSGSVIHTPGHSPGSVSIILETGEAFVGDLAMNRFPLTLKPSLSILGDDREEINASWDNVLRHGVSTIHPAHGKPFSVEAIR